MAFKNSVSLKIQHFVKQNQASKVRALESYYQPQLLQIHCICSLSLHCHQLIDSMIKELSITNTLTQCKEQFAPLTKKDTLYVLPKPYYSKHKQFNRDPHHCSGTAQNRFDPDSEPQSVNTRYTTSIYPPKKYPATNSVHNPDSKGFCVESISSTSRTIIRRIKVIRTNINASFIRSCRHSHSRTIKQANSAENG